MLAQLQRAQDQIVTRQKLAELGELAAGVAHEIRNPLNFMRNFAEATDELLVELREGLDNIDEIASYFASLAYNGSKAMHPELQLIVQEDLDPGAGEITVIAEDMGRVVLNMVNNSCYAADEKRLALGIDNDDYLPMVWLQTERKVNSFEIRVRDNGTGIEPDVIGKIFNPFFTTKPTDKGTGLGLSLANDIVREHGGTIEPKSQAGEFTEMLVSIPIN